MVLDRAIPQEPELLDIAQAAAFLHVSPMSLRRWTNSGRLSCCRVGGRRERRFRRADLLALLERNGEPARAPPAPGHLCGLYTTLAARERRAAAFLAEGLEAGGTCFLAAEAVVHKRVLAWLARDWPAARAPPRGGGAIPPPDPPPPAPHAQNRGGGVTRPRPAGRAGRRRPGG